VDTITDSLLLGKPTAYPDTYDSILLCPIPRRLKRDELGITGQLPFTGEDIWNSYELSWLDPKGKPVVAMGEIRIPCSSEFLIESKSFKLYLNSFNQTRFACFDSVSKTMSEDLTKAAGAPVSVTLYPAAVFATQTFSRLSGECIDELDIEIDTYDLDPSFLEGCAVSDDHVDETLYSHLLKSNCLVTGQPDWASILIRYQGPRIDRAALLRYLVSFRRHNEFHEQCVERIFTDILRFCHPVSLTVYARYTRRGGLDINPFRSNFESSVENLRLPRQ